MEIRYSSETSVDTQRTTRRHIPEDDRGSIPGSACKNWGRSQKTSDRMAGFIGEIRTEHPLNRGIERYRYTKQADKYEDRYHLSIVRSCHALYTKNVIKKMEWSNEFQSEYARWPWDRLYNRQRSLSLSPCCSFLNFKHVSATWLPPEAQLKPFIQQTIHSRTHWNSTGELGTGRGVYALHSRRSSFVSITTMPDSTPVRFVTT
jgi:hypothetical protein